MATTRYIINNLENQTIDGSLTVTGTFSTNFATYKALLTQTEQISGDSLDPFFGGLIIGEEYTIGTYSSGDDFSNIAEVVSGTINTNGCVFVATGETPAIWSNDSVITSSGNLVVQVLENTLGYDLDWTKFNPGTYLAINGTSGPQTNSFPRKSTHIITGPRLTYYSPPWFLTLGGVGSMGYKDDLIFIGTWDLGLTASADNALYYQSVEIKIKKDQDTTPVTIEGTNIETYPFGYVGVRLFSGGAQVGQFVGDNVTVNNINELIEHLNSDSTLNYLGSYSINEGVEDGIILTIAQNLKNQFSPDNTLTFTVYQD